MIRNPVQASQTHDVVQTDGPGMASGATDGFDKILEAGIGVAQGVQSREVPVLAILIEIIRWRADANAWGEQWLVSPVVGSDTICGEGEVLIKTDGDAGTLQLVVGGGDLLFEAHLDISFEVNLPVESGGEGLALCGGGGLVDFRPLPPMPGVRITTVEVAVKSHVGAVVQQPGAPLLTILIETLPGAPKVLPVQQGHGEALDLRYGFIVHQISGSELIEKRLNIGLGEPGLGPPGNREFGDCLYVQIEQIVGEDAQGKIGTGVVGGSVMDGVEGIECHEIEGNRLCQFAGEIHEVGEIAHAPIALAAQRRQKAVDAVEMGASGGEEATVWRENPANGLTALAGDDGEVVIAERGQLRSGGLAECEFGFRTVFPLHPQAHGLGLLIAFEVELQALEGVFDCFDKNVLRKQPQGGLFSI